MKKPRAIGIEMASSSKTPPGFSEDPSLPSPNPKRARTTGKVSASQTAASLRSFSPSAKETAASFRRGDRPEAKGSGFTRFSADELWNRSPGKTDWARVDALTDEDIARAVANDPDAVPLDLDWSKAKVYFPKGKTPMSLRIDPDVLAFFKATGKGFQTRMNAVLRAYMDHETAEKRKKPRRS